MKSLNQVSPNSNYKDVIFNPSDYVNAYVSTGAAVTFTVNASGNFTTDAHVLAFSATGNFYVNWNGGTAAVPAETVNGTASELNPTIRNLRGVTSFSIFAASGVIVTIAAYAVGP